MRINTKIIGIVAATTTLLGLGAGVAAAGTPVAADPTPNQVTLANQSGGNLVITHYSSASFFADAPKVGTVVKTGGSQKIDLDYDPTNQPDASVTVEAYSGAGKDLGQMSLVAAGGRNTFFAIEENDTTLGLQAADGTVTVLPTPPTQTIEVTVYNKSDERFQIAGYQQNSGKQLNMWQLADPAGTMIPARSSETFPVSFSSAVTPQGDFTVNELNSDGTVHGSFSVSVLLQTIGTHPTAATLLIYHDSTDTVDTLKGNNIFVTD